MFDTHCHPYLAKEKKLETILANFKKTWWKYLVSIWVDLETSKKSIELANKYDFVYASVWIHPTDSLNFKWYLDKSISELEKIIKNNKKVVWVWECWLDYYWIKSQITNELSEKEIKQNQKDFFMAQIKLAEKYNKPFIIHSRDAKNDLLNVIKETWYKNFILHCFSEDYDFAKRCLEYSKKAKISFSWILTFKNAIQIKETAKKIPLENILVETDSPYLTPSPFRWKEENEPSFVKYIIDYLSEIRSEKREEIEKQLLKNSLEMFWLAK